METLTKILNDERTAEINGGENKDYSQIILAAPGEGRVIIVTSEAVAAKFDILNDIEALKRKVWEADAGEVLNRRFCEKAFELLDHAKDEINKC